MWNIMRKVENLAETLPDILKNTVDINNHWCDVDIETSLYAYFMNCLMIRDMEKSFDISYDGHTLTIEQHDTNQAFCWSPKFIIDDYAIRLTMDTDEDILIGYDGMVTSEFSHVFNDVHEFNEFVKNVSLDGYNKKLINEFRSALNQTLNVLSVDGYYSEYFGNPRMHAELVKKDYIKYTQQNLDLNQSLTFTMI